MVFDNNFLTVTVIIRFRKNEYFKTVDSLIIFFSQ